MNRPLAAALLALPCALLSTGAQAIPSPDLVINLFASMGQLLGMLSVLLGGAAVTLGRRRKKGGSGSPWPFRIAFGLFLLTLGGFSLYTSHRWDLDMKRLQTNLVRPSIEEGRQVGDASLKSLSFSDQLTHPRGISTETLDKWIAEGRPLNLIDVREREETEAGRIPEARHITYPKLLQEPALALTEGRQTILLCYSGNRSGEVCEALAEQGVDCRFVIGGYEKWIAEDRALDTEGRVRQALRELPPYPHKEVLLETHEVERLVAEERAQFVDVRYPGDFELGHLPGAVNLPIRKMVDSDSAAALRQIPKDRPVVVPCYDKRSCFYAQILGLRLHRAGYDFRGRYTVPHEYMKPIKERTHVAAWEGQHQQETFFGILGRPLEWLLMQLTEWSGDLLLAILLLVLALRALLLPFSIKTEIDRLRDAARAPQVKALKEQLREHPARLQRALRAIAQEDRSTPFVNLVGNLVQLVLFIVLFTVVGSVAAKFSGPYGWLPAVSRPDPYYLLPLLVAGLTLLHMGLMTQEWTRGRTLLNLGSALLLFLLTFRIAAALNLYLAISIGLLTLHGIAVRAWCAAGSPPSRARSPQRPSPGIMPASSPWSS
jgi:rifampicin phosphotransferase